MVGHKFSRDIKKVAPVLATLLIALATSSLSKLQAYAYTHEASEVPNAVYEQVELVSLVFRLAGHFVFIEEDTEYQRSLTPAFREFGNHPVVERTMEIAEITGFDGPISFAIHLEKANGYFQFINGTSFWEYDTRWTQELANEYLLLLNDFYIVSNFNAFFEENTPYFEWHSRRLHDELIDRINFDWFYQFGFDPESIRTIIRPSGTWGQFGPTFLDSISYAVITQREYYGDLLSTTVHELAHSFANPIAEAWYEEDEGFRSLIRDAASTVTHYQPWYVEPITVAREYVTRAYTILYLVENHNKDLLSLLLDEYNRGFRNIETMYAMITEHEPMIIWNVRLVAWGSRNALVVGLGEGTVVGAAIGIGIVLFLRNKKAKQYKDKVSQYQ